MVVRQRDWRSTGECQRSGTEDTHKNGAGDRGHDHDADEGEDRFAHDAYALRATANAARSIGSRRSATPVAA